MIVDFSDKYVCDTASLLLDPANHTRLEGRLLGMEELDEGIWLLGRERRKKRGW